jgi:hypothetical protein
MFLGEVKLEAIEPGSAIDAGAEEELFREMGQRAAVEALKRRWEEAGAEAVGECAHCGKQLKDIGFREKEFRTLCGPVKIRRRVGYCGECHETTAALDKRLSADNTGTTPGLARVICRTALEMAYQPTKALLTDTLGFTPCSAREIERIAKTHGAAMEEPMEATPSVVEHRSGKHLHLHLSMDGTMIPGLADPQEHRLKWHEVKVAVVEDVRGIDPPFYVASTGDAEAFGKQLNEEMQARGMDGQELAQITADGAPWIWNLADIYYPGAAQLLDFYHASEHLHKTAAALWPKEIADAWCRERQEQLKTGDLDGFFSELTQSAQEHASNNTAIDPKRLLNYFETNRDRLGYADALKNNLPIGSGVIESAGRHIVQQRLKQSGMRWSLPGAQAVLNLRTRHRNGQFEQYWENFAAA